MMTLPVVVPTYFLPAAALALLASSASTQATVVFDDIVIESGTRNNSFGRGSAMVDLDQDGLLDLVCADASQQNQFYQQQPDGTFIDAATIWGIPGVAEYDWGVLAADFDNDGDNDLYFGNGGSAGNDDPTRPMPNQLLRNDIMGTGVLTDVSSLMGDAINPDDTFGMTALDFDRDGFLDIFNSDKDHSCKLLRNTGGLYFVDVSTAAGITRVSDWRHCGAADIDNDGWPDIGVGSYDSGNALYHNQQDGTFMNIAASAGVLNPIENFGLVFQDYDNDGLQDIFIPKYQQVPIGPSPVYLNQGDLTFVNVSQGSGIGAHTDMGHESADIDSDGYPDIILGTGNPFFSDPDYLYTVVPNGAGGLTITDISTSSGFNASGISRQHGQAIGDYDRDGDIDIYCNNGGPHWMASTSQSNFFMQNRGNANAWTALEIAGVYSNRTGVGVVGKASTTAGRDVYRTLQVGRGFGNTPDHALHFGIGSDAAVERIELRWPSGIVQCIDDPAPNAYSSIVETGALLIGTPTIGQAFSFDFAGAVGEVVELAMSNGTATSEIDGVNGSLLLAAPYILLPPIPLDASGRRSLSIPVPDLPALVGLSFYAQGWIHAPGSGGTLSQLHAFTIQ
ncbi:MAG: hypothetical protein ACI8QS_002392 [Planctomycetota bacterium]|jgi:hypothetical protein